MGFQDQACVAATHRNTYFMRSLVFVLSGGARGDWTFVRIIFVAHSTHNLLYTHIFVHVFICRIGCWKEGCGKRWSEKTSAAVWRPKTFHVYPTKIIITRPFFRFRHNKHLDSMDDGRRGLIEPCFGGSFLLISYFRMKNRSMWQNVYARKAEKLPTGKFSSLSMWPQGELIASEWMMLLSARNQIKCLMTTLSKSKPAVLPQRSDMRGENYRCWVWAPALKGQFTFPPHHRNHHSTPAWHLILNAAFNLKIIESKEHSNMLIALNWDRIAIEFIKLQNYIENRLFFCCAI